MIFYSENLECVFIYSILFIYLIFPLYTGPLAFPGALEGLVYLVIDSTTLVVII